MHADFLKQCLRFGVLLLACVHAANCRAAFAWEVWTSPYALAQVDPADQVLERSSHCADGCRYDRSNPGSEDSLANPYPTRWLYADGNEEVVFEDDGPGAISRIWMTTGNGQSTCFDPLTRIHIYIDGAATPVLDAALSTFFSGTLAPFTVPLVFDNSQSSGGYVSYLPIAYRHGVRVSLLNADNGYNSCTGTVSRLLWFQFHYHRLVPGSMPVSFDGSLDAPAWRSFLATAPGNDPWAGQGSLSTHSFSVPLAAGADHQVDISAGPGWLRGVQLVLPRDAYAHVRLRLTFDGATAVDLPLNDFFALAGNAGASPRGVLIGESSVGALYSWWPMSFRQQAKVELIGDAQLSTSINIAVTLVWDATAVSAATAPFVTQLHDTCPSTAGQDLTLYAAQGAGRVVGISAAYHAYSAATREYLEGDERAYRDGSRDPAWYGTGVEDFYNAGFYLDHGAYAQPLSGATLADADGSGVTAAYRLLLTDFLSYGAGVDLRQEAGPTGQLPICARTVAYAYASPQPALLPYTRFEVGDAAAVQRNQYQPAAGANCAMLAAGYSDEPSTSRNAQVCSYSAGTSAFAFAPQQVAAPLRLRRIFDAAQPGQAAEIRVNGVLAGFFPYTAANPQRRWAEQDALLETMVASGVFQFEIRPRFGGPDGATIFTESAYELWGGYVDGIFHDGFDTVP